MYRLEFHQNSFGDPFTLAELPLPRLPQGYAVQMLDIDKLLDRESGNFLPVRDPQLKGLFSTFYDAHDAACQWVDAHCLTLEEHQLAIVPARFDHVLKRHVLIYGVLCGQP